MAAPRDRVTELAAPFIGAAAKNPARRPQILREAAKTFAGWAREPQNQALARRLNQVASQFAQAADEARPPTVEDFEDLLAETVIAQQEVGGNEIDMFARRSEIHNERSPGSHLVSIAPASITEATGLGRVCTIKWNPSDEERAQGVVQSQTVAFWQGTKRETQAATVDVNVVQPPLISPDSTTLYDNRPYGIVTFGSDGNLANVKFDIGFGTRFTVVGHYVSVELGMDPPRGNGAGPWQSVRMSVGASIGMFAAPSLAPVVLTNYVDALPATSTTDLIPRPVKSVQLLPPQSTDLGATFTLRFFAVDGTTLIQAITITNGALGTPIPLGNDVAFYSLRNNGAAPANYRLPFQLSL